MRGLPLRQHGPALGLLEDGFKKLGDDIFCFPDADRKDERFVFRRDRDFAVAVDMSFVNFDHVGFVEHAVFLYPAVAQLTFQIERHLPDFIFRNRDVEGMVGERGRGNSNKHSMRHGISRSKRDKKPSRMGIGLGRGRQ